jgi:HEPN domain-containing protein
MAERMLRSGFSDGAVFHGYHAYECAVSALIAASGVPVPTSHTGRFTLYDRVQDARQPYALTQRRMRFLTARVRNEVLYYDEVEGRRPADRLNLEDAAVVLTLVHRFAREVWAEIR